MALSIVIQGKKLTQAQLDAITPVINAHMNKRMSKAKFELACIRAMEAAGVPVTDEYSDGTNVTANV